MRSLTTLRSEAQALLYRFKPTWKLALNAYRLHPYIYRTGRAAGTREAVVHPNYILIYRLADEAVEIVSVIHSRRVYPFSDD